jgi:SNF2 family DNA or RNA helicase
MNNQELAFEKLSKLKCGALFMEMGTGKTKTALDIVKSKIHKINYVLWICPFSLKNEIEKELNKWHPDLKLKIIGCESLGSSDRIYFQLLNEIKDKQVFCIVDESLKIKNIKAKRTKRILEIGKLSKYRLILNGTPISKNIVDLYTQMEFLSPKILNMNLREFNYNYVVWSDFYPKYQKGQKNIEHLIELIKPYVFDSKLELDIEQNYRSYSYSNNLEEEYNNIKEELLNSYTNDERFDFYVLCTRLQRCYTKSPDKQKTIDWLLDKIDSNAIIFVKYLDSIPENSHRITGSENLKKRQEILSQFENREFKTLYMTYGVGSYGLNLQFCNHIIFAEHSFDYAQKVQAEHRIFRMGQNEDVNYYDIICDCGLEDIIIKCLRKKTNFLNEIKKEIEKKGPQEWAKSI